ncbi:hypothetical protein TRVA0_027S00716 [Trichomonascus vanleenenianus]|uniref:Lcl3p n=1 Tax=Trichomonascus vanleenenianus TaxID=2268995 RepID=UPI003EC96FC2
MAPINGSSDEGKGLKLGSFLTPEVLVPTGLLTGTFIGSFYLYRSLFRRVPNASKLPESFFKRRTMLGRVTSVGDADNFHFYHTPGGVFGGWGWLRRAPEVTKLKRGELTGKTIHIRLNGIDAPECAHFGRPAQPFSGEALEWLRGYIYNRRIRIKPLARDQYSRIVASAEIWTWTGRKDVSVEMVRNGWAMVYEGKTGSEFDGNEELLRRLEQAARKKRIGMFQKGAGKLVTPGQYKKMYR